MRKILKAITLIGIILFPFVIYNIGNAPKNYYEIGKVYCWELNDDPFLSEIESLKLYFPLNDPRAAYNTVLEYLPWNHLSGESFITRCF